MCLDGHLLAHVQFPRPGDPAGVALALAGSELNAVKTPFLEKWEKDIEELMTPHAGPQEPQYLQVWTGVEYATPDD